MVKTKPTTHFRTHQDKIIKGDKLQKAFNKVANWYEENALAAFEKDNYAPHVTLERKRQKLDKDLALAQSIREGHISSFCIWQRVDAELTGECVAFLPK